MTTGQLLLSAWDWNPVLIGICVVALFGYAAAARRRLAARSGYFIMAVAIFFCTLASPVNALADGYLFSAHMLQHLMLLLVVPPLLLLGLPEWQTTAFPSGLSPDGISQEKSPVSAQSSRGFRLHPFAAWLAGLSAMWIWHERTLCDLGTTTHSGRVIQITSLLALGTLFWWPIVGPQISRRLTPLPGVLYLFSACVGCTILGILITFAPVGVVCPVYLHPVDRLGILALIREQWGITPARDQQAGGLMMWVPACGIYLSGVISLLARWYRAGETSAVETAAIADGPTPGFSSARITGGNA